jgi:hypothetical protein
MQLVNEAQVFETWSPIIEEKTGINESNKLKWMSKYAHYHSLNEGFTYPQASLFNTPGMGNVTPASTVAGGASNFYGAGSQGSGDKFPSLLPLAIQVAARTVGFDIVSVVPMNGPSGVLTYLDYVYAGGRDPFAPGLGNQNPAIGGQTAATTSRFNDKFKLFKLNPSAFAADYNTSAEWKLVATGSYFTFSSTATTAGSSYALLTQFVGLSRIDGFPIFNLVGEQNGTVTLNAGAGATVFTDLSSQSASTQSVQYYAAIGGPATTFVFPTTYSSGGNGSAWAMTTSANDANDNFNASGTTQYYAELVRALEDHIQGFAGSGPNDDEEYSGNATDGRVPYEPMRRGVGETSYYRTMGLQAFTKFVEAETYQVAAQVTTEQIQDLNRQYGIDVVSMMENALVNEISQSINKHILSRAFALGWQNHFNFNAVEGTNLNLNLTTVAGVSSASFIGQAGTGVISIGINGYQNFGGSTSSFENQGTAQRRIQSKILAAANVIAQRGRRGPGNFVVTNLQIATALQDSAQFTFYPLANTVNQNNGALYPLGTLAGMTIYVDPNMNYDDCRVLVGRKGADEEPGLKFMPYLMAESIQTIAEGTMSPKIAVKSRYALVEAGFHPETQYFTLLVNLKGGGTGDWWTATSSVSIA